MKRLIKVGIGLTLAASLAACGDDEAETVVSTESNERGYAKEISDSSKQEKEWTDEELDTFTTTFLEETMLYNMQLFLDETVRSDFNKETKTYTMMPHNQGFIKALEMYEELGGSQEWNDIQAAIIELSNNAKNDMGEGYKFVILNPYNADEVILEIEDGKVTYDFVESSF